MKFIFLSFLISAVCYTSEFLLMWFFRNDIALKPKEKMILKGDILNY